MDPSPTPIDSRRLEKVLAELPESPARAAALVEQLGGLPALLEEARRFGLASLLAYYLGGPGSVPRADAMGARFVAARLQRTARETLARLAEGGVPALALKGATLAARFYPEPWLRPSSDVDLLVRPGDLARAEAVLRAAGYGEHQAAPESEFEFTHHAGFIAPGNILVEVHFTPACGFQSEFDVERIFARSERVPLDGWEAPALGLADALVHQCTHAAHHRFEGVKWLFDIKLLLLEARPDWSEVVAIAREARVASATGMSLAEAARRVRAPVPEDVLRALAPGRLRRSLARRVARMENVGIYPLSLALADRLSSRWAREVLTRPVERLARLAGRKDLLNTLARALPGARRRR